MKRIYAEPDMELIYMDLNDLVRTSSDLEDDETERLPFL